VQQIIAEANIIFLIGFGSLFIFLSLASILLVCLIIMHNILYRKLDSILFRDPFFSSAELALYSAWPLSLVKSAQYMFLITYPNFLKRKRFKGLEQELPIGLRIRIASKLYMYLEFLTAFLGVFWLIFLTVITVFDNYFVNFI